MQKMEKESWAITEKIIQRYPVTVQLYEELREELLAGSPFCDGQPRGNFTKNRLEEAMIKLQNPKAQRMEREIQAVEQTFSALKMEHKIVIEERFWKERGKKVPYKDLIHKTGYEERQLKRIVSKFIYSVAEKIGEI